MNTNHNDQPGEFAVPGEVRLVRLLPGPIERVWDYLTDPEKRARWFAGGLMEPRAGGKAELVFRHANISPNEEPPAEYRQYHDAGITMEARVLRWEPPRALAYTFGDNPESHVSFELTPQGDQVLLVLTQRGRGEDLTELPNYASGWHTHLTILIALLEGATPPPFWATHLRLKAHYTQAAPKATSVA